jgi:hypothetical protein
MSKEKLPAAPIFQCQENGSMTSELMKNWIKAVWNRRPGFLLNTHGMLVPDAFNGHLTHEVKGEIRKANSNLVMIPGDIMLQLKMLDVVINKPFKNSVQQLYSDWFLGDNHVLTLNEILKKCLLNIYAWGMDPDCMGEDF